MKKVLHIREGGAARTDKTYSKGGSVGFVSAWFAYIENFFLKGAL